MCLWLVYKAWLVGWLVFTPTSSSRFTESQNDVIDVEVVRDLNII